ncbi:MAG: hypothetical protein JNM56_22480 [Planctomycetia bacterium]|nr:hypothetical protein [Planctomycetia bacterium]
MRTFRCHLDHHQAEGRTVAGERPRYPRDVPGQPVRCPLCCAALVALQGTAGPRWHCRCQAKAA